MGESQKHYSEQNEPETEQHLLYDPIYMKFLNKKN